MCFGSVWLLTCHSAHSLFLALLEESSADGLLRCHSESEYVPLL